MKFSSNKWLGLVLQGSNHNCCYGWKCPFSAKSITSATSRCILVLFERYGHPKYAPKNFLVTLFPYIFHIKPKWNIVCEYLKTKIFSRDSNILPQMHWVSNTFDTQLATIIGGFRLSLNYPILNFTKKVCPKNVWMLHWSHKTNIEKHSHNSAKTYILIIKISFWKFMIWFCYSCKKKIVFSFVLSVTHSDPFLQVGQ